MFRCKEGGETVGITGFWTFSDDAPSLRAQEGAEFSKGVMVSLDVSKCGIGRLIFAAEGGADIRRRV